MASVLSSTLAENNYENWIRADFACCFAKEGLKDFIERVMTDFQQKLLQSVITKKQIPIGSTCTSCTTANVLACPTVNFCTFNAEECSVHDLTVSEKMPSKPCPKKLCDGLRDEIVRDHRFNSPSWRNSDARRWCTDSFAISKCYMPSISRSYCEMNSLAQTDFAGMITIIYTNKVFQKYVHANLSVEPNICKTARDIAIAVRYSQDQLVSDNDLDTYIDVLTDLLTDRTYLAADHKAQEAVWKLNQLRFRSLAFNTDDVSDVLRDDLRDLHGQMLQDIQGETMKRVEKEMAKFEDKIIKDIEVKFDIHTKEQEHIRESVQQSFKQVSAKNFTEPRDWEEFLNLSTYDDTINTELMFTLNLPNQNHLNRLQKKYLETKSKLLSELLKHIDNKVCQSVKKSQANIQYSWLGYSLNSNGEVNVQLFIEMKEPQDDIKVNTVYNCTIIRADDFTEEANLVLNKSDTFNVLSLSDLHEIRNCITKLAGSLMANHKHLSIISASPVRSKGFSSQSNTLNIIPEKCILLYVRRKGYIPIGEDQFENEYNGFRTDVREGVFRTSMMAANENTETLKMGCKIARKLTSFSGEDFYNYGTLGGFIDHPQYGLCGLTCAHVLLDDVEMARLQESGELTWLDLNSNVDVYHVRDTHIKCGRVVKAILTSGNDRDHGIDAAIFQIEKCSPTSGVFVNMTSQADDPVHFNTGKAYGPSRFSSDLNVFKFGATTGKTSGVFLNRLPVITVRVHSDQFPADLVLHNQIEIKGIGDTIFSDKGDSGSLVMIDGHNRERFCVGIVEGDTSFGSTIVTPVHPVLESMNVASFKCFEADQLRNSVVRLERSLAHTNYSIDETKNEVDEIRASVHRLETNMETTKHEILSAVRNLTPSDQRPNLCRIQ